MQCVVHILPDDFDIDQFHIFQQHKFFNVIVHDFEHVKLNQFIDNIEQHDDFCRDNHNIWRGTVQFVSVPVHLQQCGRGV